MTITNCGRLKKMSNELNNCKTTHDVWTTESFAHTKQYNNKIIQKIDLSTTVYFDKLY